MNSFKNYIRFLIFKTGFYPEKLPYPPHFYQLYRNTAPAVRNFMIKNYAFKIRSMEAVQMYDIFLQSWVPKFSPTYHKARFMGFGAGRGNLNVYRKLWDKENIYLEKVYFTHSDDLEKLKWLYKDLYPIISPTLRIPMLFKEFSSDILTIQYYEFFSLSKFTGERMENELINMSGYLYKLSNTPEFESLNLSPISKDFKTHPTYSTRRMNAAEILKKNNLDISKLEVKAFSSKLVITHGDISPGNVFKGKILLDWDSAGIYPLGFDPAYTFYFLNNLHDKDGQDFERWLVDNFKDRIKTAHWKQFKENFFFFLFVFFQEVERKDFFHEVSESLLRKITKPQ